MIHGVELIMNAKDIVATDRVTASSTLTFSKKIQIISLCIYRKSMILGSINLSWIYVAVSFRAMVIALITGGFDEAVAW
jgi:hypothetical protein